MKAALLYSYGDPEQLRYEETAIQYTQQQSATMMLISTLLNRSRWVIACRIHEI
jgi:hypothetical protein